MSLDLSLNNFRCWESKSLSIPSCGLCLINGKSGKGKSTILNAILYVITGKLKNITSINKKSTNVTLKIDNITVTRSRGPNRLSIEKDGKVYESDEAQGIINSIFGPEFSNTSYIDQDNAYSFVSLSPSDKMEFLEKLLLHNYNIEKIKDNIKTEISKTKSNYISEESKINTLEELLKTMKMVEQEDLIIDKVKISKNNYEKVSEKIKANQEISDKNIKVIKTKLKKLEDEQLQFVKINEKASSLKFLVEDMKTNPLFSEIGNVKNIESYLSSLEKSKIFYINNKDLVSYKEKYNILDQKYKNLYDSNKKEIEYLQIQIDDIKKSSKIKILDKNAEKNLAKCLELVNTIYSLENKINDPVDFEIDIQKESVIYENTKDLLLKKQRDLSDYEKCYKCPSCQKILKINDNKLVLSNSEYETDINPKVIQQEIEYLKNDIKKCEQTLSSLKKQQTIYQQTEQQYNEMFDQLDTLRGDIECDNIKTEVDNINKYFELSKKIQSIENDKFLQDIKRDMEIVSSNIDKLGKNIENSENSVKNDEEYTNCIKEITSITNKLVNIKSLELKIESVEKELSLMDKDMPNKNYNELISVEREKLEMYSIKSDTYKTYIEKINNWSRITKENERYIDIQKSIEISTTSKQDLSDRLRCLVKLREHVKNSEQKCISDFIDSLNEHASIYIEEFFPDEDIKVELKTKQETKSTGKEKIALNFELNYRQINGDLSYLSGGERDRVNLAFTLAFSEIINNRILLLDECISSLDAETTNVVLENLKEKYKGKLVILVSHQANLGFFDKVIDI